MKQTTRPPARTIEEIADKDNPDIGLSEFALNEPVLQLPIADDPLYVEKPIDKYEPTSTASLRNKEARVHDEN